MDATAGDGPAEPHSRRRISWRRARNSIGRVTTRRLIRSLWLGTAIGLVAGLGAILFSEAIAATSEHILGTLAGYRPANPVGEGGGVARGPDRPWALPLVLGLGGLLAGIVVFSLAPEAEGHGTDAAIDAYHRRGGRTRIRAIPVKLVASAITIGFGGAAGREGPTAQIGAGFGSLLAERLGLDVAERRRALAAGMGAGIGAIFRAPLGGALMAAEVLYKHDFEAESILLNLIASIVAYSTFGAWAGWTPIFGQQSFKFSHPSELPYYVALGLVCGVVGLLYAKGFYGTVAVFHRIPVPRMFKPALGGIAVGMIGMFAPEAIHVGYGTIQGFLTVDGVLHASPWLLVSLPLLRIMTTSFTVGSGGSGGIFGPGMVIGGVLGAAAWRAGHSLPGFPAEPGPVVIICMIATFGSIAHVPLAMLLMVGEMTGNLSLLAPAMVAVAVATLVTGDNSIYESQVATRADSPAHRHRFAFPLLSAVPVWKAMRPAVIAHPSDTVSGTLTRATGQPVVLVRENGHLLGGVRIDRLARVAHGERETTTIYELLEPAGKPVRPAMPLDDAFDALAASGRSWLAVVDGEDGVPVGVVDGRALMRAYREAASATRIRREPLTDGT